MYQMLTTPEKPFKYFKSSDFLTLFVVQLMDEMELVTPALSVLQGVVQHLVPVQVHLECVVFSALVVGVRAAQTTPMQQCPPITSILMQIPAHIQSVKLIKMCVESRLSTTP